MMMQNTLETSPAEQIQNELLRPILKSQNELILALFRHYLTKHKFNFARSSPEDQSVFIDHTLKKDKKFKNLMIGIIVGHFSAAQWQRYAPHEEELNRRIATMLIKRIDSQKAQLVD
jgi:hypothetical protein